MSHDQEFVRLERLLVIQHAVTRDPDAVESGPQRAHPAHDHRTLGRAADGGEDHGGKMTEYDYRSNHRHCQHQAPEQQAPQTPPIGSAAAPELDPVSCTVEADDLFFT